MKKRRVFDEAFKRMAVDLSYAKSSVYEAARELGIDSSRITKWRQIYRSSAQLIVGLAEDGFSWEEDGVNVLVFSGGLAGLYLGGWVAVSIGAISIVVAVVTND